MILAKCIYFYCLLVCLWMLSYLFLQDTWWVFVVFDKFAEYALAVSIPVFLYSVFCQKTRLKLFSLVPILVTGYFYAPFVGIKPNPGVNDNDSLLRVMTYNIWNQNEAIDDVVELIKTIDPDVLAVQELTEKVKPELISKLSPDYPFYFVSQPVYGGTTAMFSRTELSNVEELDFGIDRPAIFADVYFENHLVTAVSAHLNPSFWAYHKKPWREIPSGYQRYIRDQNTQAKMIIATAQRRIKTDAVFLACDCNSQETASTNRLLKTYFKDVFRTAGLQFGQTTELLLDYERNLAHIDYVWFRGDLEPQAVYRGNNSAGSDHDPVVVDFILR